MKPNSRANELALLGLTLAPYLFLLLIWNGLPDRVPTHFGLDGQPDRYSSKVEFALVTGAISALMYGLFLVLPGMEPRQRVSADYYNKMRWVMVAFWAVFVGYILLALKQGWSGETFISVLLTGVFLLMAVVGNLMNSVKPNFFIGIRTPWTLSSEEVWRQTHRLASRIWTIGGLLAAGLTFFLTGTAKLVLVIAVVVVLALIPVVYSFVLFKKLAARHP